MGRANDGLSSLIAVSIAGVACAALVDTGACRNILPGLLHEGCGVRRSKVNRGEKLCSANKLPIPIIGELVPSIKVGDVIWPSKFAVVENIVCYTIYGMEFLESMGAFIDVQLYARILTIFNEMTSLLMTFSGEKLID